MHDSVDCSFRSRCVWDNQPVNSLKSPLKSPHHFVLSLQLPERATVFEEELGITVSIVQLLATYDFLALQPRLGLGVQARLQDVPVYFRLLHQLLLYQFLPLPPTMIFLLRFAPVLSLHHGPQLLSCAACGMMHFMLALPSNIDDSDWPSWFVLLEIWATTRWGTKHRRDARPQTSRT